MTELEVNVVGLAGADVVGTFRSKGEVGFELTFLDIGVHLADDQVVPGILPFERCGQSAAHAVDIVLVDQRFDLVVRQVVDLTDLDRIGN